MRKLRLKGIWSISVVPQIISYRADVWIHDSLTPGPDFEQGERQVGRTTWPPTSRGFRSIVDTMMSSFPWVTESAACRSPQLSSSPGLALGWRETRCPRSHLLPGAAASNVSTRGWKRPVFAQLWKCSHASAPGGWLRARLQGCSSSSPSTHSCSCHSPMSPGMRASPVNFLCTRACFPGNWPGTPSDRARKETGTIPCYTENIPGRDQKGLSNYRAFLEEAKIQQNFER